MIESTRRRPVRAILVVALIAVGLIAALLLLTVPLGGETPARVGGHPLLDEPAPEIDLSTIDGEQMRLSDLRGWPVLVNFWATWCIPCRDEFPMMVAAYEEHAEAGLEILGIVHDDTADGARRFAADMGATWPMLMDPDDSAWTDFLGIGVPMSLFIDREGVIRSFSLGPFTQASLDAQLARILPRG